MPHSFVVPLLAGAALTVSGCQRHPTNPPTPDTVLDPSPDSINEQPAAVESDDETADEEVPPQILPPEVFEIPMTSNPPGPLTSTPGQLGLPTWDEVASNHPQGATNPPMPILAISADGKTCAKEWADPRSIPPQVMGNGGIRVLGDGETSDGERIVCPQDRVDAFLGTE